MLQLTFALSAQDQEPLYRQIYDALTQQIRTGRLARGTRMPGKRTLADQLGVSVNTVDAAYQMLVAEGYLESRTRSGFFVMDVPEVFTAPQPQPEAPPTAAAQPAWRFDCSTGNVDASLFPVHSWGRIQRELLYDHP